MHSRKCYLRQIETAESTAKRLKQYLCEDFIEEKTRFDIITTELNQWRVKLLGDGSARFDNNWKLYFVKNIWGKAWNSTLKYSIDLTKEWKLRQIWKERSPGLIFVSAARTVEEFLPPSPDIQTRLELVGFSFAIVPTGTGLPHLSSPYIFGIGPKCLPTSTRLFDSQYLREERKRLEREKQETLEKLITDEREKLLTLEKINFVLFPNLK